MAASEKPTIPDLALMKYLVATVGYRKSFGVGRVREYTEPGSTRPVGEDDLKQRLSRLLRLGLLTFGGTGNGGALQYLLADDGGKAMSDELKTGDLFENKDKGAEDETRGETIEESQESQEGGVVAAGESGLTLEAEKRAKDALQRVKVFLEDQAEKFLLLGGELRIVERERYYKVLKLDKFDDYVEQAGMQRRMAYYYMQAYDYYCDKYGDTPLKMTAKMLGFTKASYLIDVITPDNREEWFKIAAPLSTRALKKKIEEMRADKNSKAKPDAGDDEDSGESSSSSGSGKEEKPVKLTFSVFPAQKQNIERCLELVAAETQSEKPGHNLDTAATMVMAHYMDHAPLEQILAQAERTFSIKMLAFNTSWDLVHGSVGLIASIGKQWAKDNGWVAPEGWVDASPDEEDGDAPDGEEFPDDDGPAPEKAPEGDDDVPFDGDDE